MSLTHSLTPDRSHVAKSDLKHWAKHFNVSHDVLETALAKVGTSVDAVRLELMRRQLRAEKKKRDANDTKPIKRNRTKPMDMQPNGQGAVALPMGSASASKKRSAASTLSKSQAERARKKSLKKQRAAQQR